MAGGLTGTGSSRQLQTTVVAFMLGAASTAVLLMFLQPAGLQYSGAELQPAHGAAAAGYMHENPALKEEFRQIADLPAILKRVASVDRTIIMTTINEAFAAPNSLLELFLESFHVGEDIEQLLNHVLVVCVDPLGYERCKSMHQHCYFLKLGGSNFTAEKEFMTKDYLDVVWSKLRIQRLAVELGYNFIFSDVDVVWFRNPLKYITAYADVTMGCDIYFGDPDSIGNFGNTGLIHVRSTPKTVEMMRYWEECKEKYEGAGEQHVLLAIKEELAKQMEVKFRFVEPTYFGGFCTYGKDLRKIATMHANCCVGLEKKASDLRSILNDWKKFRELPGWAQGSFNWTLPGKCIA